MADQEFATAKPDLQAIEVLTPSNDDILQRKAGAWANRTIAQLKTDLAYTIPVASDTAYDATSWNANTDVPTKNAVRDKIEAILAGVTFTGDVVVPDEAYDATAWNGSLEVPTKNAIRDKIETMGGSSIDGSGSAGVLAGWVDSDTLEGLAGLTTPSGAALRIEGQASGDTGLIVRGNTSDDDNILELRRGSNDGMNVSWNQYGDLTVEDRFVYYKSGADIRGGWHPSQGGFMIVPGYAYCFTNGNSFNTIDARLERIGVSIVGLRDGAGTGGAAFSLVEQTAPSAPAANGMYQWLEDNGSGKTRWMCRFGSGAAIQVAIEP